MLEERVGGQIKAQYIWSPVYVDALILRDRDTNGDGTLDERLYVAQDANSNVTALFDNSGTVVERYVYDPFGQVTVLDAGWNVLAASAFAWPICTKATGSTPRRTCILSGKPARRKMRCSRQRWKTAATRRPRT